MGRWTTIGLTILAAALTASSLWAQDIGFTATVDRTRAAMGQPIHLTLTISSSSNLSHLPAPEIALGDFDAYGPSVGTRMEIVNGRTTFARELTYELYARAPGRYTIGPARLSLDQQVYRTQPLAVEVTRAAARGQGGSRPGQVGGTEALEDNLFLRATADRTRAYVGQQVTASFDLCYRYQLRDVQFKEIPSFAGFWSRELFVAQRLEPRLEAIGGEQYNVAPLRQMALFPTSAGKQRVDPMAVTCSVSQAGRRRGSLFDALSLFDDPLFDRGQAVLLRSQPLEVEVLPLPAAGRPPGFSGAVGQYQLSVEAHPLNVAVGDPVTLKVTVSGVGNLQALSAPAIAGVTGLKVYEPKVEESQVIQGGRLGGSRTFEYILIPERGGQLQVPALRVAYFDPEALAYREAAALPVAITSTGSAPEEDGNAFSLTRQEIQALGSDIRHIKPDVEELRSGGSLYASPTFWVLQVLVPVAFAGLVLYERHRRRLEGDVAYARRRRAPGEARQRLRRAREVLEGSTAEFHAEVQRAVLGFVADTANAPAAGMTSQDCDQLLARGGAGQGLRRRVAALLEGCEYGRFAPGAADQTARVRLVDEAEELIAELGSVLT
ncbi:MAG: BatD family protein [Gemmatimonadota bacterium]